MFRHRPASGKALVAAAITVIVSVFACLPAQAASQQDWDACTKGVGDVAIAACTRIVEEPWKF